MLYLLRFLVEFCRNKFSVPDFITWCTSVPEWPLKLERRGKRLWFSDVQPFTSF